MNHNGISPRINTTEEINYFSQLPGEESKTLNIGLGVGMEELGSVEMIASGSGSRSADTNSSYLSTTPSLILSPPLGTQESTYRLKKRPSNISLPSKGLGLEIEDLNHSPAISPRQKRFYPASPDLSNSSSSFLTAGLTQRIPRRDSSNSEELPMHSPLLESSPRLDPNSKAIAKEKAEEKAFEIKEKARKGKHARMFSWATRPEDLLDSKRRERNWKSIVVGVVMVVGFLMVIVFQTGILSTKSKSPRRVSASRSRLRRGLIGSRFIHPDVVDPYHRRTKSANLLTAPYRSFTQYISTKPFADSPGTIKRIKDSKPITKEKKQAFVGAGSTPYAEHHPLPPPLSHDDSPDRDTLVLYRILGNDLPPRHSPGQTLRNLRFLLQYESDFSTLPPIGPHKVHHSQLYGSGSSQTTFESITGGLRVDKYFVLNRIADLEMLEAIKGLLKLYSIPESRILVIPFEWEEYQKREFKWDGGIDRLGCWSIGQGEEEEKNDVSKVEESNWRPVEVIEEEEFIESETIEMRLKKRNALASLTALDFMYHDKNLYAMNNNGGRNFALDHGRSLSNARWILPLDGNSFLTPAAMDSIVRTLSISGEGPSATKYLIIPMARLLANDQVLPNNSIALLPKHLDEIGSATADAELHHSSPGAPPAFEEPQIGFRFDASESFQPAMRYGRRSKLELLWRLGAIPYSRGLDKKTFSWEFGDREHITKETWNSIPGATTLAMDSSVHSPHLIQYELETSSTVSGTAPVRGGPSFSKAGWVYRLFSGDKSQEELSSAALVLRNTRRIEGIVAFLEKLDEQVARGIEKNDGFRLDRIWSFDSTEVDRLRQQYRSGMQSAVVDVESFEKEAILVYSSVQQELASASDLSKSTSFQSAATNVGILALAGYLTSNASYSILASEIINTKFITASPLFHRQGEQKAQQLKQYQSRSLVDEESTVGGDSEGYAFPTIPFYKARAVLDGPALPFDPLEFDPTILLDSFRLLALPNSPQSDAHTISRKAINSIFSAQLSYLLYSPAALEMSRNPPSSKKGVALDTKIAVLAAFFDDAKLLSRVANRGRLRLPSLLREFGLISSNSKVREIHWALLHGLSNVRFRPYNLISESIPEPTYLVQQFGEDNVFEVLGL